MLLCVGLPILSHVVIGHVIEPKLMGDSLELHPITARAPPPRLASLGRDRCPGPNLRPNLRPLRPRVIRRAPPPCGHRCCCASSSGA